MGTHQVEGYWCGHIAIDKRKMKRHPNPDIIVVVENLGCCSKAMAIDERAISASFVNQEPTPSFQPQNGMPTRDFL
jgi:hypothetical protein